MPDNWGDIIDSDDREPRPSSPSQNPIVLLLVLFAILLITCVAGGGLWLLNARKGEAARREAIEIQAMEVEAREAEPATDGKSVRPLEWQWSKEKATLKYSIAKYLMDFEVDRLQPNGYYSPINIRSKPDRTIIYSYTKASESTVFTRWKNVLYVAEYYPIATGCKVVAVDLKSGNRLWETKLQGIGPIGHSRYSNQVNIDTDGQIVTVMGFEADGRYIEHLDIQTGKMLANKKLDAVKMPE